MKKFPLMLLFILSTLFCFAQKKLIDSNAYNNFPKLSGAMVSDNGKYVVHCEIEQMASHNMNVKNFIQSTDNKLKIEIPSTQGFGKFTADSKFFLFKTLKDSLGIMNLDRNIIHYISNVSKYEVQQMDSSEGLVYLLNDLEKKLVLRNLRTGRERHFYNVLAYWLSEDWKTLVIQRSSKINEGNQSLDWIDLSVDKPNNICDGKIIENLIVDFKHKQLVFKSNDTIWHYKIGMDKMICLVDLSKVSSSLFFGSLEGFNKEGDCLFATLDKRKELLSKIDSNTVQVWSYNDTKLQSLQDSKPEQSSSKVVIRLTGHKVIYLQKYKNEVQYGRSDHLLLTGHSIGNDGDSNERSWNLSGQNEYDLVNNKTGKRTPLLWLSQNPSILPILSPEGKYILYYDYQKKNYFSYDIALNKNIELT
ncbi:hypothetical protein DBR11_26395, partial [Pedobacter sp. HMWF019]|uniref:hypothetical protein n=1 Tax=Pedobacter sp. HMWF019 TaxID=2056856 RepID=UPI000D41D928